MSSRDTQTLVREADAALDALLARADADPDAKPHGAYARKRVADVLLHLHAWHIVFEGWMAQHLSGAIPAIPAEGYEWSDIDALNEALYLSYRDRSYTAARALVLGSHRAMCELVLTLSDEELNRAGHFPWLGEMALGDVAHECLAGHYAWAQEILDPSAAADSGA